MDKLQPISILDICQSYPLITQYLSQSDRINFHSVNHIIRQFTSTSQFWPVLELSYTNPKHLNCQLQWFSKYLHKLKPTKFIISIYEQNQQYLTNLANLLIQGQIQSITNLDIFCQNADIHLACSLTFPNIQQLTIRSKCINNQLLQLMLKNLHKLCALNIIKNDMEYNCKNMSRYITNPIHKLIIKPYSIYFQEIQKISNNSINTLQELEIDVEQCGEQQIIGILGPLVRLQKLRLYHLQYLSDDTQLYKVLNKQQAISQFVLTKAYNMQLCRILQTISTKYLLYLDITDCRYASDNDMKNLVINSKNIKYINISWCNGISCQGLQLLLNNCLGLENVSICGIKDSKDKIFGKQYNKLLGVFDQQRFNKLKNQAINHPCIVQNMQQIYDPSYFFTVPIDISQIKTLRRLKYLDCNSCNSISDNILKIIYIINRIARTYNYYGNYMGLFPKDTESTFC